MKNEKILDFFRSAGPCEWCGRWCQRRQPHHYYWRKSMGGGGRIDHRYNLVGICFPCHTSCHFGQIHRERFLAIVSRRERKQQQDVIDELQRLRRIQ